MKRSGILLNLGLGIIFFVMTILMSVLIISSNSKEDILNFLIPLVTLVSSMFLLVGAYKGGGKDILHKNIKRYRGRVGRIEEDIDPRHRITVKKIINFTQGKYIDDENKVIGVEKFKRFISNFELHMDIIDSQKGKEVEILYLPATDVIVDIRNVDGTPVYDDIHSIPQKIYTVKTLIVMGIALPLVLYVFLLVFFIFTFKLMMITIFLRIMVILAFIVGIFIYWNRAEKRVKKIIPIWLYIASAIAFTVCLTIGIVIWTSPNIKSFVLDNYIQGDDIAEAVSDIKSIFFISLAYGLFTFLGAKISVNYPEYFDIYIEGKQRRIKY